MVQIGIKKRRRKSKKFYHRLFYASSIFLCIILSLFILEIVSIVTEDFDLNHRKEHAISKLVNRLEEGDLLDRMHVKHYNSLHRSKSDKRHPSVLRRNKEHGEANEHGHNYKHRNRHFEKLPDHCSTPKEPLREIVIKGERHTGTNWLRSIIRANVSHVKLRNDSREFGWKHGFFPPDGWGRPLSENEVLVVITRDVFTWLPKMLDISYDPLMDRKRQEGFSAFIRAPYGALCQPLDKNLRRSEFQTRFCAKFKRYFFGLIPLEDTPAETADNLIKIREQKYKQWLSNDPIDGSFVGSKESFLKNRIHIRLESLVGDQGDRESQYQVIGQKLLDRCIRVQVREEFHEVTEYTKWIGQKDTNDKKKEFNVQEERKKLLATYTKEDLRFVLSQLDMEFEKRIGYDYTYIYDILKNDDIA